ncbi:ABC transporter permease [Nocardioides litoris]|uniref:ABC transporter permease n=1 Tax=Nocardioides litoris TaxID=1926648 RepID=UPI001123758C|nr:ABC transporter permease [Nocardioides litoris]
MSEQPQQTSGLWRVVAEREVTTQLRSKTFLASGAVLVLGLVVLIVVLELLSGRTSTDTVAVVDDTAATAVEAGSTVLERTSDGDRLEVERYDDAAAAERAVRDGDVDVALLPAGGGAGYELVGDDAVDASVSGALTSSVAAVVTQANAERDGVDLQALGDGTQVSERLLDPDAANAGLRQVASFVFVLLFYLTALGFGMQIASTVTQEKESRVVEILAAAIPIRTLLWGKVIGTSILAIGQTVVLAVVGVVGLLVTGNTTTLELIGPAIAWYVLFFVIGFVALASFWSVAGSLAGRQQDLQATTLPLQVILFAPYIVTFTAGESVRTVMSMFPIVSTMLMPSRLAEGDVPLWQLGVAIATTLLAAVLLVRVAARVYEATLLQTGRKIGYGEALRTRSAD